jgi:hypothetical protein
MEVLSKIHYAARQRNVFIQGRIAAVASTMPRNKFVVNCPFEDDDAIWVTAPGFTARFSKKAASAAVVEIGGVRVKCTPHFETYDDGSVSVRLDATAADYGWFWIILGTTILT